MTARILSFKSNDDAVAGMYGEQATGRYAAAQQAKKSAHQLTRPGDVRAFMFAGNARLTLVSRKTGARFTYRVRRPDERSPWFVSVLTGSDNEAFYSYLGLYRWRGAAYEHGRKAKIAFDAPSSKAWRWFDQLVVEGDAMSDDLEIWHEGRCGRCGRALTVPESIERGIGPECAQHLS